MKNLVTCAALLWPTFGVAEDLTVVDAFVPLAPKGAMAHAAYMEVTNTGGTTRSIIGVTASDYAMAHIHQSIERDGVATMIAMHQLDIKPGQTVVFEQGGLHVMLMKPVAPLVLGESVALELQFSDGETMSVAADVVEPNYGS